jgi:hypothetical protein
MGYEDDPYYDAICGDSFGQRFPDVCWAETSAYDDYLYGPKCVDFWKGRANGVS